MHENSSHRNKFDFVDIHVLIQSGGQGSGPPPPPMKNNKSIRFIY